MTICTQGFSAGRPNHLAPRTASAARAAMADEIALDKRRQQMARREAEWIADGTLPGPGWLYQPVNERGENIGGPVPFVDAMLAIWGNPWRDEPDEGKQIIPVGPATGAATEIDSI